MPVKKFRNVSEMEGNTWHEPNDPRLFDAIKAVWRLAAQSTKPRFPPGVYKHRSIERANENQHIWDQANFEAFLVRRRREQARRS